MYPIHLQPQQTVTLYDPQFSFVDAQQLARLATDNGLIVGCCPSPYTAPALRTVMAQAKQEQESHRVQIPRHYRCQACNGEFCKSQYVGHNRATCPKLNPVSPVSLGCHCATTSLIFVRGYHPGQASQDPTNILEESATSNSNTKTQATETTQNQACQCQSWCLCARRVAEQEG